MASSVAFPTVRPAEILRYSRLLYLFPLLTLALTVHQAMVARDSHRTYTKGIPVVADVTEYERKDMAAQAHGIMALRIQLPDGRVMTHHLTLPIILVDRLKNLGKVPVHVLEGSGEPVVLDELAQAQLRMALVNVSVAGLGTLMLVLAIAAWIRYLKRRGDPGERPSESFQV